MTGRRDALIAGLLAGPMAMLPAILFFICMVAYYPQIHRLRRCRPDYLLEKLNMYPVFRVLPSRSMIFAAVLESATGGIHAINELRRLAPTRRREAERCPCPRDLRSLA